MENDKSVDKQTENLEGTENVTEESSLNTEYVEEVEEATTEELTEVETPEIPNEHAQLSLLSSVTSVPTTYEEVHDAAVALNSMKVLAQDLIQSKLCRLKTVNDVVLAIITGKQYGFNFITSINNIYPINGTPTMSTHLIRAQLLKNKIMFEKVYDNAPIYQFYKAIEKDGELVLVKEDDKPVSLYRDTLDKAPTTPYKKSAKPVDFITTYKFERMVLMPNGEYRIQKAESSYTMGDAFKAELQDKDNWKKYQGRMLDSRAFNFGAREIADDILLGMYSLSELAEINGLKYTISSTLHESLT